MLEPDHASTATGPVLYGPMRSFGRSWTGHDQSLTVLSMRISERTGTVTETGPVRTALAVRSVAVQSRSLTGLQTVFGPDSWTLLGEFDSRDDGITAISGHMQRVEPYGIKRPCTT